MERAKSSAELYADNYAKAKTWGYNNQEALAFAEIKNRNDEITDEEAKNYAILYGKTFIKAKIMAQNFGIDELWLEDWSNAYAKCLSLHWSEEKAKGYADTYIAVAMKAKQATGRASSTLLAGENEHKNN